MTTILRLRPNAWIAPFAILIAACAALPSLAQQQAPPVAVSNAWLGVRYDSTHIQIILESSQGTPSDFKALQEMLAPTEPQPSSLANRPEAQCEPLCFPPISLRGADAFDKYVRQHSSQIAPAPLVKPGDAFLIQLGNGSIMTATVSRMLGTSSTDGFFLGALATVAPRDVVAFQATSAKVFIAVRRSAAPYSKLATLSHTSSVAERQAITVLLRQHSEGFIAGARARFKLEFHAAPEIPAAQTARLQRLLHGEGTVHTEITPVKLASGESRYYVRAEWLVGGKATFAVAAWIAVAPQPSVLWWDADDAARCFAGAEIALDAPGSGMSLFSELLNVATLPDGRTGLALLAGGYESFDLNLDLFSDAGPLKTSVSGYGDGG